MTTALAVRHRMRQTELAMFRLFLERGREIGNKKLLDARQTYPPKKGKRKGPDIRDKNCSPDFFMILDLDCNFTSADRRFERRRNPLCPASGKSG